MTAPRGLPRGVSSFWGSGRACPGPIQHGPPSVGSSSMADFLSLGRSGFELLLVVLGFGFIIFIHELGHFLAAKWAGIRVLAFAIGFGPAAVSYRRGLGWRRGSSEREYQSWVGRRSAAAPDPED